jgi:predicted metal-dependent hydrolase
MAMNSAKAQNKPTPDGVTCPPRNLVFVRRAPENRAWLAGDATETAIFNALSLTFPEGERFFIEAVKAHRAHATGALAQSVQDFIAQEAFHTREHVAFNNLLGAAHYPTARAEELVRKNLNVGRAKGVRAMLAITVAMEHLTAIFAEQILNDLSLVESDSADVTNLWLWHSLEETEHKSVAFDLFREVTKDWSALIRYKVRVHAMAASLPLILWNWTAIALLLMEADGVSRWTARWRIYRQMLGRRGL